MKMLKRHIKRSHELEPDEYRAKWRLNHDYPMVSPNYSEVRRKQAIKNGLGRKPKK
jgi:predicted transcriptional regulator